MKHLPWNDLDSLAREIPKTETCGEALLLVALWGRRDGWRPKAQVAVDDYRIDVAIPEAMIAVESDGFEHHSKNVDLERDHRRQNALVAAGWTPLRYTAQQAFLTSGQCAVDALREINKRLRGRPPAQARPNPPMPAPARGRASSSVSAVEAAKALLDALSKGPGSGDDVAPLRRRR